MSSGNDALQRGRCARTEDLVEGMELSPKVAGPRQVKSIPEAMLMKSNSCQPVVSRFSCLPYFHNEICGNKTLSTDRLLASVTLIDQPCQSMSSNNTIL